MNNPTGQNRTRNLSIDTFRVVGVFAIVLIHTNFLYGITPLNFSYGIVRNISRFAIPFFMITSGYFFAESVKRELLLPTLKRYLLRLMKLFLGWSLVYAVIPEHFIRNAFSRGLLDGLVYPLLSKITGTFSGVYHHPAHFLINGTSYHLWFFSALMMGAILLSLLILLKQEKYLLFYAAFLFTAGLFITSHLVKIRVPSSFLWGNGPFYSTAFFAIGWQVSQRIFTPTCFFSAMIILLGIAFRMAEVFWLQKYFSIGENIFNINPCTLGAALMGMGVFFLALSQPMIGAPVPIFKIAPLTLGIYTIHPLVISDIPGFPPESFPLVVWQVTRPLLIFMLSAGLGIILKKFKVTRGLVS